MIALAFTSCSSEGNYRGEAVGKTANFDSIIKSTDKESLAEIFYKHGNFINTKQFPPIIKAKDVYKNIDHYLLIDIRNQEAYEQGHINGAYNVPKEQILDFVKAKQKAVAYDKVVIICYSGQIASYVTGILRYAGFDNVYVMLYGMAGWNSDFNGILKKGYGKKLNSMIEKSEKKEAHKEAHHVAQAHKSIEELSKNLPKIETGLPYNVIEERARKLLNNDRKEFLIKTDEFLSEEKNNSGKYYTIFYLNQKKFDEGHIKGANLFKSRQDLSLDHKLAEVPKDKPVVVYCKTGHTGGNAAAYLDMLGYDAHNLMFGLNAIEYNSKEFPIDDIAGEFPVISGAKRTSNKVVAAKKKKVGAPKKPIAKRKKKAVSGGCG